VKLDDSRVTVRVCAVPKVPLDAETVLFLGIVGNTLEKDAAMVPLLTPVVYCPAQTKVFVPSAPCVTLTVLENSCTLPLLLLPVLNGEVKLYCVPSIIRKPGFEARQ
jgi:hypothetical protein